jgi:RNA polymerase sigma-70 factor (ECF subfamily)
MRDDLTDEQLMILVQKGDDNAFDVLIFRWQGKILSIAKCILGNKHDAEDITQDTFMEVHRSKHTYNSNSKFSPWITTIAVNKAYAWNRKRKHWQNHLSLEPGGVDHSGSDEESPLEEMARAEFYESIAKLLQGIPLNETTNDKLIKAFMKLSEIERFILWEHYAMGKTWKEVAYAVNMKFKSSPGIPMEHGACRVKAWRAIEKLHKWFKE